MHIKGKTPGGRQRWRCHGCQYSTTNPIRPRTRSGSTGGRTKFSRKLSGVKRLVITAAQNSTPVHRPFFSSLLAYCEANSAELVVVPIRYKNPTSRWPESQADEDIWDTVLEPWLHNQRKKLNDHLVLLADIKTQPTAVRPLSGFETITQGESGILAHTKLQLTTIPTPQHKLPKILTTTGAVTVPNYTDTKAGKKGEFHHALAAAAVEIEGNRFHLRQINADKTGAFIDLDTKYSPAEGLCSFTVHQARLSGDPVPPGTVSRAPPASGLAMGDTHRQAIDPLVEQATFGPGGIVETLNPEYLIFHDVHDGYAENPHHRGNPFIALAKHRSGKGDIRKEVVEDVRWIEKVCSGRKGIIVGSNHDDFLSRWVVSNDWRADPENAEFYLETALEMVRATKMTEFGASYIDPFQSWVAKLKSEDANIRCLGSDESFMLHGIECGLHGDRGPNGARGSRMNLRRIGVKTVIGHAHSPGIEEGTYQVGTSTPLRLEYTRGPSSWMQTHCVIYANGKRSLINIIDGRWRGKAV